MPSRTGRIRALNDGFCNRAPAAKWILTAPAASKSLSRAC
jgi:hypothetical protein